VNRRDGLETGMGFASPAGSLRSEAG
jgi:hypothetical protein